MSPSWQGVCGSADCSTPIAAVSKVEYLFTRKRLNFLIYLAGAGEADGRGTDADAEADADADVDADADADVDADTDRDESCAEDKDGDGGEDEDGNDGDDEDEDGLVAPRPPPLAQDAYLLAISTPSPL